MSDVPNLLDFGGLDFIFSPYVDRGKIMVASDPAKPWVPHGIMMIVGVGIQRGVAYEGIGITRAYFLRMINANWCEMLDAPTGRVVACLVDQIEEVGGAPLIIQMALAGRGR